MPRCECTAPVVKVLAIRGCPLRALADEGAGKLTLYDANFAGCHSPTVAGRNFGPAVLGKAFQATWQSPGSGGFFAFMRTQITPVTVADCCSAAASTAVSAHSTSPQGSSSVRRDWRRRPPALFPLLSMARSTSRSSPEAVRLFKRQ